MPPIQLDLANVDRVALEKRFRQLEAEWLRDTAVLSSPPDIINHPAFQAIIAFGPAVVPLLLRDLEQQPSLWVWALPEITGDDVKPEKDGEVGTITLLSRAWVRWGRERGLTW